MRHRRLSAPFTKTVFVLFALAVLAVCASAVAAPLEADWNDPPRDARLRCWWWWLNSHVTEEAITRDLEEMKAKGMGGAMVFDADGSGDRKSVV